MIQRLLLIVLVFLLITSCSNKIIPTVKYSYGGMSIYRVDKGNKTSFFYVKKRVMNGNISVSYSGINDGFSGYLYFHEDGKVELLSGDGNFKMESVDTTHFVYKRIIATQRPTSFTSACYITLPMRYEKQRNDNLKSGVKVEYLKSNE